MVSPVEPLLEYNTTARAAENLEIAITIGLEHMDERDFFEPRFQQMVKVKNAVSFGWAVSLKQHMNVFIASQARAGAGFIDDYALNGRFNAGV